MLSLPVRTMLAVGVLEMGGGRTGRSYTGRKKRKEIDFKKASMKQYIGTCGQCKRKGKKRVWETRGRLGYKQGQHPNDQERASIMGAREPRTPEYPYQGRLQNCRILDFPVRTQFHQFSSDLCLDGAMAFKR
jgi:hypothetical protein